MSWYGKNGEWGRVSRHAMYDQRLTPMARVMYAALASYADTEGDAYPGNQTVADGLGISTRYVQILLKELAEAGWISRSRRYLKNGSETSAIKLMQWGRVNPQFVGEDELPVHPPTNPQFVQNRPGDQTSFDQTTLSTPRPADGEEGSTMGNPKLLGQEEDYDSQSSASDLAPLSGSTVEPKSKTKSPTVGSQPWLVDVLWPQIMADAGVLANEYLVGHLRNLIKNLHKNRGLEYEQIGRLMTAWSVQAGTDLGSHLHGGEAVAVFQKWLTAKGKIDSILAVPEYQPVADNASKFMAKAGL